MLIASQLRAGSAVRIDGALYKVIEVTHHAGQGKMGGSAHVKLRHLETGTIREWRFRPDEPVEDIAPERQNLQFLYMVPPFIAMGEMIRVDVERGTYVERAHKKWNRCPVPPGSLTSDSAQEDR